MTEEYIVTYSEGERGKALVVCNNKHMRTIDSIDGFNCLLVEGDGEVIKKLEVHDFIEDIESNSGGVALKNG